MAKCSANQLLVTVSDIEIGRDDRNRAEIFSKGALVNFVNGGDESFCLLHSRKMVLFEGPVEGKEMG